MIGKAAHRSAAAGIKPPRRCQPVQLRALDRGNAQPRGQGDILGRLVIGRSVKPQPRIRREGSAQRAFRLGQGGKTEPARGIKQTVCGIPADLAGQPGDRIVAPDQPPQRGIKGAFRRTDQLRAVGVGQAFLPDRRRIVTDPARQSSGIGRKGIGIGVVKLGRQFEGAVALAGVGAAESRTQPLLLRAGQPADDQRAFRPEQVAVRPAGLHPETFARAITGCGSNDPRRAGFLPHQQIDLLRAVRPRRPRSPWLNRDGPEQAGRDKRLAQVIHFPAVIKLTSAEPGQRRHMIDAKSLAPLAADFAVRAARPDRYRQGIGRFPGILVQQHVALAKFGERIAIFWQGQRHPRFGTQHAVGDNRLAKFQRQAAADQIGGHGRTGIHRDCGQGKALARRHCQGDDQRAGAIPLAVDPRCDQRIEPARGGEQLFQQDHVFGRPAGDLGGVARLAARAQQREPVERVDQVGREACVDLFQARQPQAVSNLGIVRRGGRGRENGRLGPEGFKRGERRGQLCILANWGCSGWRNGGGGLNRRALASRGAGQVALKLLDRFQRPAEFRVILGPHFGHGSLEFRIADNRLVRR